MAHFWLEANKDPDASPEHLSYFKGRLDIAVIEEESSPSEQGLVCITFLEIPCSLRIPDIHEAKNLFTQCIKNLRDNF